MIDILIICPLEDIYDKSREIIEEQQLTNVNAIYVNNMYDGLSVATKWVNKGTSIIITRGGIYDLIKKHLNVILIDISISINDILPQLTKIADISLHKKVSLVGVDRTIEKVKTLIHFLDINFDLMIVDEREKNIDQIIKYCIDSKVDILFGDGLANKIANITGCSVFNITAQKLSLNLVIEEALRILQYTINLKQNIFYFQNIANFVREGIIAINKKKEITVINEKAEKLLGLNRDNVINKPLSDYNALVKLLTYQNDLKEKVLNFDGKKLVVKLENIVSHNKIVGSVALLQEITEIQKIGDNARWLNKKRGFVAKYHFEDIIYSSKSMEKCLNIANEFSKYDANLLIIGESGVGKEMICQSIHNKSDRREHPFVAINCAAIPESLIESEFFGYAEGAFTGAIKNGRPGIIELANNGTVFLDEIGELPLNMQGRLLRVLQEKEIMRIGDSKVITVDIRVICATNRKLDEMVVSGHFRKDLFFRINTLNLQIPNLNDRGEDCILILANHFLKIFSLKYHKKLVLFTKKQCFDLVNHYYIGNVRELSNIIERYVILDFKELSFDFIPIKALMSDESKKNNEIININSMSKLLTLEQIESHYIQLVHEHYNNITETANALGINRTTLWRKLRNMDKVQHQYNS